ncbi:Heterokaryon incompatibility protein 6,OR allele [Lachnellula hyalina]|uniref:Heterokaryon incompatibility protein 6,OR allele n=1 Tax=Lachnellula hyalina TaxID=1316788 RepID=A0A8H8R3B7_9HELO|nr:Heterokaryon incompatibility protein 6,OR allele [Lachnellula hyalina]TVY27678.1 Heterokaryon incompatibility protein 6,OR allele [Lachnellula hyalina]
MAPACSNPLKADDEHLRGNTLQAYAYQPLLSRHIRLLGIEDSEELHIIHVSLNSAPAYTALSYTWNGELVDQPITVDRSSLKVINNFRVALPHLIKAAKTQYLWVDGLCINQEDDREKAVQVPLMQEIYASCSECLIWLGKSTPEGETAFDAIPRIRRNLQLYDASRVWDMEGIGLKSPGTIDSSLWKGLTDIFSRPWFKRIWTFQEAVIPPEIFLLFGDRVLAFDDIVPLADPLLTHFTSLQYFHANDGSLKGQSLWVAFVKTMHIHKSRTSGSRFQNCFNTLRMLYFTRPWHSTNPLDKIYGLLGLTDPSLPMFLTVDYSKSAIQVSIEISKWYLEHGGDLFILNLASSLRYTDLVYSGLPSWAPFFGNLGSHWCIGVIWQRFRTGVSDSRQMKPATTTTEQKLHVRGLRVDEVSHIVPCIGGKYKTQAEKC